MSLLQLLKDIIHVQHVGVGALIDRIRRPPGKKVTRLRDMVRRVPVRSDRRTGAEEVAKEAISAEDEVHGSFLNKIFDLAGRQEATNSADTPTLVSF